MNGEILSTGSNANGPVDGTESIGRGGNSLMGYSEYIVNTSKSCFSTDPMTIIWKHWHGAKRI